MDHHPRSRRTEARMADSAPFRFSPRPNRAAEIAWNEWGDAAFERARHEAKPVLLGISAVWCHWCHVMDETSYSDEGVIRLINDHYVPIRVDNDRRPDINARYNMGGWPTTAFLTPEGEVMAGLTYVPPDQMRDVLTRVNSYFRENRSDIDAKAAELAASRSAAQLASTAGELTDQIFRDALDAASDAYDPVHGGFGGEPKFPHTDAIELLLRAHLRDGDRDALAMARKTLDNMCGGGTYDHVWGGFFRYSTKRDWSIPHYEKMLEDNAQLLRALLRLYRITGDAAHRRYVDATIAYIDEWLSDAETGAFYGSQDADEEFYPLSADERARRTAPDVDPTVYTSWNAMAIGAWLDASWTLDRPELERRALRALDFLWDRMQDGGVMFRYLAGDGPRVPGLLEDQAWTAAACLDAYEVAGRPQDLERARTLARAMIDRLAEPDGGFFDRPSDGDSAGLMTFRQKPAKENAVAAGVLVRLSRLLRELEFEEAARRALRGYAGIVASQGHFAAAYAIAVDQLLNPGADVRIVARDDGSSAAMRRAALRLPMPDRLVSVIDPGDREALDREGLPADPVPAAYVCYGSLCSALAASADDLFETAARTREAYERTRRPEPLARPRGGRMASD
ncbi:MAG: thioredoxin domain-containing protein [Dehalococcoidia bacterium]|nr:MAG: thioredoxin domain-containing protein [Dehalococcoidia bacterium]